MPSISTTIEIAASPAAVRAVFLDFPNYSSWHTGFFKLLESTKASPEALESQNGTLLKSGDTLHAIIGNDMHMYPVLETNSPGEFMWLGKLWGVPGLFNGHHFFRFEESKTSGNEGGTTFVQGEEFSGILTFLVKDGSSMHTTTKEGFEGFNKDLKAKCEQQK